MNDLNVIGDVKEVLTKLLPMVKKANHSPWRKKIEGWKQMDYQPETSDVALKPYNVIRTIADAIGKDGIFTTDVGQHQMWAAQYCGRTRPRSFISSGGLGTMGFGYGAAIGAKTACPDRPVVHITGDGSFHMNLNELCTTVSYGLPVITVLLNNQVLGMVRQWQTTFYGKRYSCTTLERKTDYVKLAEAFGAAGCRCTTPEELRQAMQAALTRSGPTVIECVIDRDERVLPMIPAGQTVNDIILK